MATRRERKRAASSTYKTKKEPYDRSAREYIKQEYSPKVAKAVGKSIRQSAASGKLDLKKYKAKVRRVTTKKEATDSARAFRRDYKRKLTK